jgi:hypothetical protein
MNTTKARAIEAGPRMLTASITSLIIVGSGGTSHMTGSSTTATTTTATIAASAGMADREPRNRTADIGTMITQTRLVAPHEMPPDGKRLRKRMPVPTADMVTTSGPSRWLRRNTSSAEPNTTNWHDASTASS